MPQLIKKLSSKKIKVGVFPISEDAWIDIGQWNEYKKTINKLSKKKRIKEKIKQSARNENFVVT